MEQSRAAGPGGQICALSTDERKLSAAEGWWECVPSQPSIQKLRSQRRIPAAEEEGMKTFKRSVISESPLHLLC